MSKKANPAEYLSAKLLDLANEIEAACPDEGDAKQAKQFHARILKAYAHLKSTVDSLDPIQQPTFVFEPSNPELAGKIAGLALIAQPRQKLNRFPRFYGSGVYAIYYNGDFAAYAGISKKEHPIYVGKADPAQPSSRTPTEQGDKLFTRLTEHRKNIEKAQGTLRVEDFEARALVVQSGYQSSAENYLINLFKPIWNSEMGICYGFGKHGDSADTRANLRSPWDTLHPGRAWAANPKIKDAKAAEAIVLAIEEHIRKYPPVKNVEQVLQKFLAEMR